VLVVLAALGGLSACRSTPSARRVAFDVIDTLEVTDSVKACMRDKVEGYTANEVKKFAEGANKNDAASVAALDKFEADLASCRTSG
jgi:hypothetical protein